MDTNHGWEVCYQAALFELDDTKLRVKIDETRHAIDQCLLQGPPRSRNEGTTRHCKCFGGTQSIGTWPRPPHGSSSGLIQHDGVSISARSVR
jgi:hypothetical protein